MGGVILLFGVLMKMLQNNLMELIEFVNILLSKYWFMYKLQNIDLQILQYRD